MDLSYKQLQCIIVAYFLMAKAASQNIIVYSAINA
jgi:hypothetical protein